jgi:carboxyl-terminal processing protease
VLSFVFGVALGFGVINLVKLNYEVEETKAILLSSIENSVKSEKKEYGKMIDAIIDLLREQYIDDIKDDIYKEALNGMMMSLDPHSAFYTEKEFKELLIQTKGEFGGLGIVVTKDNLNLIKVVSPIDDTPASKAGILAGDYIGEINGESTYNMPLTDAVEKMRGKVGEKVKLVILRRNTDKPIELILKREIIKVASIKTDFRRDGILYMRITNFAENTQSDFVKAFNKAVNDNKNIEISGFILDLRNNPGGLLDQAVKISELFLEKDKVVVYIKGKNQVLLNTLRATSEKQMIASTIPMVVLVNGGSASASEIVAGALQDHGRAIILGEKTFGKASVQQVFPLIDGSALKITVARYYTPNDRSLQLDGVIPDIIIKEGEVRFFDNQNNIREEDLKGRLEKAPVDIVSKTIREKLKKDGKEKMIEEPEEIKDYQLSKAIDLLKGISIFNKNLGNVGKN